MGTDLHTPLPCPIIKCPSSLPHLPKEAGEAATLTHWWPQDRSDMIEIIYWTSLLLLLHTWFLFGAVLWVICCLKQRSEPPSTSSFDPSVSFIVAARDEERFIRSRIENLLSLRYDKERVEVVVASDGSGDKTVAIARELQASRGRVRVLEYPVPRGRAAVHNDTASSASGEILVFTDAETRFDELFLQRVIPHFLDPKVGAVSGRILYTNEGQSSVTLSAGLYWQMEERLRVWEGRLGILAFGTGAAFCMRRDLYVTMQKPYDDVDYSETLSLVARGYKVCYEPRALAYDTVPPSAKIAHRVRLRRTSMAFRSILDGVITFRLWRRPGVLLSVISHKLLRHLTPFFMISFAGSNLLLLEAGPWYQVTLIMQIAFYLMAILGGIGHCKGWRLKTLGIPFNFVILNYSRMLGALEGLLKRPPSTYR